ncbi:amidase [Amycolatopsis acidiphila]|uniref:Amidase n=1 Tax=Amycolatopsis acidiphila TaxID=715473 RepID=A0A558A3K9_9PSEU|nr:amidase [Amycolatopsis acidiphila]TVT18839.1 amidase [Amycolatopsis acidiphila]UIJ61761.1 amidase [Amycolatopsis acidiphila]GHG58017.1 amidase [Amycolatopsis acidiphila]
MTGSQWRELGAFVETYSGPGEPVAVKDLIDVAGQTVRNGTPGLGHRVATADATVWARLRAAGHVAMGRTTVPELAWSCRTPGCANPWDPRRDAGGSSGGSAVAVAIGAAPVALGTDTGGSIRVPAALCGVAGLRPTHGSVPMDGITPLSPSMDTVGPIALTARECLRIHGLLTGETAGIRPVGGLRVGRPASLWGDNADPEVLRLVEEAAGTLRAAGVEIVDVELPLARRHARGTGYTVLLFESARQWWAEYEKHPDGLAGRAIGQLRAGSRVSTSDYEQARKLAREIRGEVDAAFDTVDALLLPTVPVTAAPLDADTVQVNGRTEDVEAAYYRLTALAAVTGHPALSVPAGLTAAGLPAGAQLIGRRGQEGLVCSLGEAIEDGPAARELARARRRTR